VSFLEVKNLHVEVEDKKILNGLTLSVEKGQVAAIMGPNGSGKSTLAYVLAGKDNYKITEGDVLLDGESILELAPDERAAKGVFLAFQYPVEVPGVATMTFLRTALNAQRKTRGEAELSTPEFMKLVRDTAGHLGISQEMLRRAVNVGFSGGEKKRNEILQMAILEPRLAVLDETDSGLDIDALKTVAEGVNRLGQENLPRRTDGTVRLAEDTFGTVAGQQLIAVGAGPFELCPVKLLESERLRVGVEPGERARAATPDVIPYVRQGVRWIVGDVGNPIAGPLRAEVGAGAHRAGCRWR
jgi:Fe-S cluster assembly ATP-binding protein